MNVDSLYKLYSNLIHGDVKKKQILFFRPNYSFDPRSIFRYSGIHTGRVLIATKFSKWRNTELCVCVWIVNVFHLKRTARITLKHIRFIEIWNVNCKASKRNVPHRCLCRLPMNLHISCCRPLCRISVVDHHWKNNYYCIDSRERCLNTLLTNRYSLLRLENKLLNNSARVRLGT